MDWLCDFLRWLEPSWVAVLVAAIVGWFTITNVIVARRAYEDTVYVRKVSQARLVWAMRGPPKGEKQGKRIAVGRHMVGDTADDYELKVENGRRFTVTTRARMIFPVEITNRSDAPIRRCWLNIRGIRRREYRPRAWEHSASRPVARTILPGESVSVLFAVPIPLTEVEARKTYATVAFTDSAGYRWKRTDTQPPKEILKPSPKRFLRLQASLSRLRGKLTWKRGQ